jgi:lambda repressor-like predicted transcriptional regulator
VKLKEKGFSNSHISHRLSISLNPEENAFTPKIQLGTSYAQVAQNAQVIKKPLNPVLIGRTYYNGDELVAQPMDFAHKNTFDLLD